MKRIFLGIVAVLVVAGVAGGVLVSRIDPETMRAYLVKTSTEATGKPLYLAQAPALSLMPLGVSFGAATWGMVDGQPAQQGLSVAVKGGVIRLDLLPLLSGRVSVREVRLDSPQVTVRPEAPAAASAPAQSASAGMGTEPLPLELARLSISNGSLLLDMGKGKDVRVENFNASVTDLKPGGEASVKLDLGIVCASPDLAGNLAFAAHVRQAGGGVALRQAKITFTQLRGPLPAAAGPVQLALDASITPARAALDNIKGSLGNIALAGALTVGLGDIPSVQGSLQLGDINVDALLASIGKETGSGQSAAAASSKDAVATSGQAAVAASGKDTSGKGAPAPGSMTSTPKADATVYPQLDIDVRAASLTARNLRLEQLHAHLRGGGGKNARYAVDPLQWAFATGGTYAGTASVELPGMRYHSSGAVRGLVVGALMQAVRGKRSVDGVAALEYDLRCAGTNAAAVKGSLAGKGRLTAENIQLNGVSVLPRGTPVQGGIPSHFSAFNAPFTVQKGVFSFTNMTLSGEGLDAVGKGVVRLPQENVDMAATVALLGMRIPVTVSGPFANLSYGVDPKWAGRALMQAPGALLEGGKTAGGAATSAGGKAGDVVRGLGSGIKGLFGK